jgi:hypothetical protein
MQTIRTVVPPSKPSRHLLQLRNKYVVLKLHQDKDTTIYYPWLATLERSIWSSRASDRVHTCAGGKRGGECPSHLYWADVRYKVMQKSESELSVLINESPQKKRVKKKAKGEVTSLWSDPCTIIDGSKKKTVPRESTKSTKEKEPLQVLDEDETTIKKLKVSTPFVSSVI